MSRTVAPEILDTLAPETRAARHSRRDLRWINRCLASRRWFRRELARRLQPGDRVLELGAGEGDLHQLAPPAVTWDALDFAPRPAHWPATAAWHRDDVRGFAGWASYSVIVGNLFFHHLTDDELRQLGAAFSSSARLVLAHEPVRSRPARLGFAVLCRAIQAHAVTRHDGAVSIEAGFRGSELPAALGLEADRWDCRVTCSALGAYRLVAERQP